MNEKIETVRADTWGNEMKRCPVCGWTFKGDGVKKHIVRMSQVGDDAHDEWLKNNK